MAPTNNPMSWKDEFQKLHQKLVSRKDSEFFREPVDWKQLGLDDYPLIIKTPMDLFTVKNKFDRGLYSNQRELASDIRLIFTNAMTYNLPGSKVYNHAKSLSDVFEIQWLQIAKSDDDIQDRPPTPEMLSDFVEKCHR
jgi:hypothetical protein